MIALSFKYKENLSDIDNEYPVKFRYFAKLFHDPQGTYLRCWMSWCIMFCFLIAQNGNNLGSFLLFSIVNESYEY